MLRKCHFFLRSRLITLYMENRSPTLKLHPREVELMQRLEARYIDSTAKTVERNLPVDRTALMKAHDLQHVGKFAEAISTIESLEGYELNFRAREVLGQCRFALKDVSGAEREFEEAMMISRRT